MVRINLSIPDRTPDRFTHVAGGERKRGEWLAKMVDAAYEGKATPDTNDVDMLRYQLIGVMAKVNGLETELNELRSELGTELSGLKTELDELENYVGHLDKS